jgi:hypothetical protein
VQLSWKCVRSHRFKPRLGRSPHWRSDKTCRERISDTGIGTACLMMRRIAASDEQELATITIKSIFGELTVGSELCPAQGV